MRFDIPLLAVLAIALGAAAPADIAPPVIPDRAFNVLDYGAVGDGTTMNTAALARAVAAASQAGGGTVRVPPGRFLTAAFALASHLDLHLDRGATLLLSDRFDDYPLDPRGRYPNQITANDCHDVSVTGDGTIDGQGQRWWTAFNAAKHGGPPFPHRPYLLVLSRCQRVLVRGVTLTNSASFHLVPQTCTDVRIDRVTITAPADAPNTDGCDPSGRHIAIADCTFDVGDDCIAVKAGGRPPADGLPACLDVRVDRCTFRHGHGLSVGGQTSGGLRGLIVRDCTFDGTAAGIRLKAPRGDGGLVEDCTYENLTMRNVRYPISLTSYYPENTLPKSAADDPARPVTPTTPAWRHVVIRHLTATGGPAAGRLVGLPEMPVTGVELDHCTITAAHGLDLWNAANVRFTDTTITAAHGPAVDAQHAADWTGIDPATGRPR